MITLRKIDGFAAVIFTILAVYLHLAFLNHAGGLWRDEINSVSVANLDSIAEVWRHIEFDSFPIFWLLILRFWSLFTGGSDILYRILGLGIGIGILGALWFNARVFKISFPCCSIALLGFSPAIIRWGDAMRGYGLGIAFILLTFGLVWRVVERPTGKNVTLAALAALIAAQTLYYNSVLVFALCMGGFVVAARDRKWKLFFRLLLIGGVSALSLLPYVTVFRRSKSWAPIFQYPDLWKGFQLGWFWDNLSQTLNSAVPWAVWIWATLFFAGLVCGIFALSGRRDSTGLPARVDLALFALTASLVALVAYFLFLNRLQYLTQQWYYIALLAFIAMAIDVLIALSNHSKGSRVFQILFLAAFVGLAFWPARSVVRTRMTNVDLAAQWLKQNSASEDAIFVTPWYCGITFSRYYDAPAFWTTIPPIEDHRFHRVDLLLNHMTARNQSDPVRPILNKIEATLKQGHRVWILGPLLFLPRGQVPPLLLAAPNDREGWHDMPYYEEWSKQIAYFVQAHAIEGRVVNFFPPVAVNVHENLPLIAVEGWRAGN